MNKIKRFYIKSILKRLARAGVKSLPFTVGGVNLLFDLTQKHELDLALNKYDKEEISLLLKHCSSGGCFVDVGANIGFYSLYIAYRLRDLRIVAFEPDPYCAERFKRHVEINGFNNIIINEYAVAESSGIKELRIKPDGRGCNSLDMQVDIRAESDKTIEVESKTLLEALISNRVDSIDIMKIDVEGYEFPILKHFLENAPHSLYPKACLTECWGHNIDKWGLSPIELMLRHGYSLRWHKKENFFFTL